MGDLRQSAPFIPLSLVSLVGRKLRQTRVEIKKRKISGGEKGEFLANVQQAGF